VFHLQLRQFPHNHSQFNLSEEELAPIVDAWAQDRWVSFGERKWSPHQAKLTIVEGPHIALAALSMGRGWRQAEREGQDVTQRLLERARSGATGGGSAPDGPPAQTRAKDAGLGSSGAPAGRAGAEAGDVSALLGDGAAAEALLQAWRDVTVRSPQLSPSERLALAELRLRTGRADPSA
jgi:hypothetical protein